jgi:putative ABC transport system substrate-binding protein
MDRRAFLAGAAGLLAAPLAAEAQEAGKVWRIGFLGQSSATSDAPQALPQALATLGYVMGKNVAFEWRWAEGQTDRLPALAHELVSSAVDVLIALANDATAAVKRATTTIPVVMVGVSLPDEAGFVASLARPGGNLTGMAYNPPEVAGKLVEVIKATIPSLSRIAVLWNPSTPGISKYIPHLARAARHLAIDVAYVEVQRAPDLEAALTALGKLRPDAVYVVNDPVVQSRQHQIVDFMLKRKYPAIYTTRSYIELGGLIYYGPNPREMWERSASYIDRILRGAKPADLPIEQPTKFELVINLKTARTLGLTIPRSLLLQADQVIE